VASRLVANIVRDYEPELASLTLRPFDDGRFIVFVDRERLFDKDKTGSFPKYDEEIKPDLEQRTSDPE